MSLKTLVLRQQGSACRGARLGFNNRYALAMRVSAPRRSASALSPTSAKHSGLKLGHVAEFIGRADGCPGLRTRNRPAVREPSCPRYGRAYNDRPSIST